MKNRIKEIDTLRAFAIFFVILAHIDSYTNIAFFELYDAFFAFLGLSLFFLISGYLLGQNLKITTKYSMFFFFKKRALTIYPLYFVSIVITYIMLYIFHIHILSLETYASTSNIILLGNILGLQGLMPDEYSMCIWWFIGTILLYYFIFAILSYYSNNVVHFIYLSFVPLFLLLILRNEFNIIYISALQYYSIFIIGVIISKITNLKSLKYILLYYLLLLLLFIILYITDIPNSISIIKRALMFLPIVAFILFYKLKVYIPNKYRQPIFIEKISTASYAIYLFHLQIFSLFELILNAFSNNLNQVTRDSLTLIIGIPMVVIFGYYIQYTFQGIYRIK